MLYASVVPPPSRYPTSQAGITGAVNGQPLPYTETTNILSHPRGLEYQLSVGEGTYVLRDDLLLATPPPYPSDAPLGNPNPLATTMSPPTAGTRLSLTAVVQRQSSPRLYTHKMPTTSSIWSSALKPHSIKESPRESRKSEESSAQRVSSDAGTSQPTGNLRGIDGSATPAFGEGNTSLIPPSGKDSLKRRKPKTNIIKRNSSFVSRVMQHDALPKRLQERNQEGLMVFANINRAFQWLDFSTNNMADNLTKILFSKAHALCHDVNPLTRAPNHIDTVIGFSSGDIFWYEPTSQKYARLNKNGIINPSPVSEIRWIPGSENLFLAAHMDGSLVVYDKEKEDAAFIPEETETASADTSDSSESDFSLHVSKSVNSKNQKNNPISCWKLSNQRINAFSFSPDSQHLAVVSEDGSLRVIDYLKEQLLDIFPSYYGGFLCVSWSPDGKYIVTGGQDDLVSIWSLAERQIVARCQGHQSFVTAVAFDPWRCDERNYRFGSVGEDCRLLLWDFGVGMLRRPKTSSVRQRSSVSSYSAGFPMPTRTRTDSQATARYRSNSSIDSGANSEESVIKHPVGPRARTAMLPPVMSKAIDPHPLSWLGFEADCIITSCKAGHIRIWDRPREGANSDL